MNAERLHVVARTLREELTERTVVSTLQNLLNALQTIVQQNNVSTQQNFVSSREAFYEAVTDTPTDSFTPAWRQILVEMRGEELFGKHLKQRVQEILAENQMTPGVAREEIQQIFTNLQGFSKSLDQLIAAFSSFKIGSEELAPGEAEIALLIPRDAVHEKLGDFADELHELGFILNTFSEVATGHKDDLKIRTISSSSLMVFLSAHPKFGSIIAKVVDFVVGQYKRILEIKKLHREIERLELPEEISEKTQAYANTQMETEINKFTVEIVNEYHVGKDDGRKHELTNAVRISLNMVANRIDRGFNFEVRIEPPKAPTEQKAEVEKAVTTIRAASVNMQYMRLEGPPILALPEKAQSSAELDDKSDGVKHKKRGRAKKDEPKA
jgi:hypothetical protein